MLYTDISWREGQPYSHQFNDKYFCQQNGYADAKHVFCEGNKLRERWQNLSHETFVIAETGFGTGLNFLCAWELFRTTASSFAKLHYISVEKFPLSPQDLAKALQRWPHLDDLVKELVEGYAALNRESSDVFFEDQRIKLTIIFEDVVGALNKMRSYITHVDAWFLDGFAPSKNKDMWQPEVFAQMASLSDPTTTLATFTVAGDVRRGLAQEGFVLKKIPGYGKKNQMLVGHLV